MADERVIKWTRRGLDKLKGILEYYSEHYSPQAADSFYQLVLIQLQVLKEYPESGRRSNQKKDVRSVKVDTRRRLYYRFTKKEIIVIFFWDSKLHPKKNPYDKLA